MINWVPHSNKPVIGPTQSATIDQVNMVKQDIEPYSKE